MKLFRLTKFVTLSMLFGLTISSAGASEEPNSVKVSSTPTTGGDSEITASPTITKAEVRRLERIKEKQHPSHESVGDRALMLEKNTLSY